MNYDKAVNTSDSEYKVFIDWLTNRAALGLKQVNPDIEKMKAVINEYLETGYQAHLTSGELVDFFVFQIQAQSA